MECCFVLGCQYSPVYDRFEYEAWSPHFSVVPVGSILPTYVWKFTVEQPLGKEDIQGSAACGVRVLVYGHFQTFGTGFFYHSDQVGTAVPIRLAHF